MNRIVTTLLFITLSLSLNGAPVSYRVSGKVSDAAGGAALAGVIVTVDDNFLWALTGEDGNFSIINVPSGSHVLSFSLLGYVEYSQGISVSGDIDGLMFSLKENSLALKEVVVTAQKPKDGIGTSHMLGRDALNHMQLSNMTDMAALLPGGKTANPDLTTANSFSLRSGGSSAANAAFGTALEVDGVRIGNNAGFAEFAGVDTRSVSVDNVESVEVITGVPSVEYGDLNSGVVKVHTRKGRTPLNVSFSVNPRTYQTSVSKGFGLKKDRGVVNVSGEWARATKNLVSPYESYTRRGVTLNYSNTFAKVLRFEAGVAGNVGGMNSEDDPDAFTGEYTKVRDNALRASTSLAWLVNKPFVTNLKFEASMNYTDNLSHEHIFNSYGSNQPAVHSEKEGYYMADRLPLTFFADRMVDSKELDFAASLKYDWHKQWNETRNKLKAGVQWKANGNVGEGEYYQEASLAANGYRPRPYIDYPFMHNVSYYAEDDLSFPIGRTKLQLVGGLRLENIYIAGSQYDDMTTLSPRFNVKWQLSEKLALRGGWGITEKLPSFYILYPKQEYRDIQTYGFSHGETSSYVYYTQPYTMSFNPALKWQRNRNAEIGIDAEVLGTKISLVGFYNRTHFPYKFSTLYTPFSYRIMGTPSGHVFPDNPYVTVDNQTGDVFMRDSYTDWWMQMPEQVADRTFVQTQFQDNGSQVDRCGLELTMDFPQIEPLFTQFRIDASYNATSYVDDGLSYFYRTGWSHTSLPNRSYQYVGIYANGGSGTPVVNGKETRNLNANLTAITHIPQARLIITCRVEASLLTRSRNLSSYGGKDYAFTVSEEGRTATGGDIYAGESYTAVWPVAYMDLDGNVSPFTATEAADPAFANLILKSGNMYTFAQDGYGPYLSANLSITKEIGRHVSLSFFANNFTNSRTFVTSKATGVAAIFTPAFYYGLTCRLKF